MPKNKLVDLSFPIHDGMLTFPRPWHTRVKIAGMGRIKKHGRETAKIILGTHTGTHIDAPRHFIPGGASIEKIPLEICVGEALLISFRGKRQISAQDLRQKLKGTRGIKRLIVRFGWSKNWGRPAYYRNHPYFSEDACRFLVKRGVKLLGMDTPSPDGSLDSPNHKFFLKQGVFLLEYLCNLDKLKGPQIELIALPLKIKGVDGSPARVIACDIS
jgi:kynurenine formamidase